MISKTKQRVSISYYGPFPQQKHQLKSLKFSLFPNQTQAHTHIDKNNGQRCINNLFFIGSCWRKVFFFSQKWKLFCLVFYHQFTIKCWPKCPHPISRVFFIHPLSGKSFQKQTIDVNCHGIAKSMKVVKEIKSYSLHLLLTTNDFYLKYNAWIKTTWDSLMHTSTNRIIISKKIEEPENDQLLN